MWKRLIPWIKKFLVAFIKLAKAYLEALVRGWLMKSMHKILMWAGIIIIFLLCLLLLFAMF